VNLPDATRAPLPSDPGAAAPGETSTLDHGVVHRERMADLGELTAGIAHELNNPIGYIGSNLNTC
jgi:C4-dicarboxylate-specific signal transduction histidine kinase